MVMHRLCSGLAPLHNRAMLLGQRGQDRHHWRRLVDLMTFLAPLDRELTRDDQSARLRLAFLRLEELYLPDCQVFHIIVGKFSASLVGRFEHLTRGKFWRHLLSQYAYASAHILLACRLQRLAQACEKVDQAVPVGHQTSYLEWV